MANQNQVLDRPAPNFAPQAFSSALCQALDFTWFRQDLTLVLRIQCFQKIQRNSGNKNSSRSVSTLYLQKRGLPLALTAPWQCWNLDPGVGAGSGLEHALSPALPVPMIQNDLPSSCQVWSWGWTCPTSPPTLMEAKQVLFLETVEIVWTRPRVRHPACLGKNFWAVSHSSVSIWSALPKKSRQE